MTEKWDRRFMRGMGDDSAGMYHRQRIENKSFYDYRANLGIHLQNRLYVRDFRDQIGVQPSNSFLYMTAPPNEAQNPANAFTTVLARNGVLHSKNTAINALAWSNRAHLDIATFTHQAHFLLAGNDTGQIVQWNGQTLNWEPPLVPAHTEAIRDIRFSHDSQNLLTCGKSGVVKYFDQHFKEAKSIVAHRNANVESLSFSPGDVKFATGASDGYVKVWDLERAAKSQDATTGEAECESAFENSGHVVWSVAWHPAMALVAAGTQDGYVKFWDPRQGNRSRANDPSANKDKVDSNAAQSKSLGKPGRPFMTLKHHTGSVQRVEWNRNGNWILTASLDGKMALVDVRKMHANGTRAVVQTFVEDKTQSKFCTSAWHPVHEKLFASGDLEGNLSFWLTDSPVAQVTVEQAHAKQIRALAWHPVGHLLASGSRDQSTRFWVPARPGTTLEQAAQLLKDPEHEIGGGYSNYSRFGFGGFDGNRRPWEQHATPQTTVHATSSTTRGGQQDGPGGVIGGPFAGKPGGYGGAAPGNSRWNSGSAGASSGGSGDGERKRSLPPGYVCKICNIPGHHITECSQYKQPRSATANAAFSPSGRRLPPPGYLCNTCGIPGHFKNECPSATGNSVPGAGPSSASGAARGHHSSSSGAPSSWPPPQAQPVVQNRPYTAGPRSAVVNRPYIPSQPRQQPGSYPGMPPSHGQPPQHGQPPRHGQPPQYQQPPSRQSFPGSWPPRAPSSRRQ